MGIHLLFAGLVLVMMGVFWGIILLAGRGVYRAIRMRKFCRSIGFIAVIALVLWMGLFAGLTPGSSAYEEYRFGRDLFGKGFSLGDPRLIFSTNDAGKIDQREDYVIQVFDISKEHAEWASASLAGFAPQNPDMPFNLRWHGENWRRTPVTGDDRKSLLFSMGEKRDSANWNEAAEMLSRMADEPGQYFVCSYERLGNGTEHGSFFLLNPTERILISAARNVP